MAAERRNVDNEETDSIAEVLRVVEQVHAPIELRRAGKIVAIVSPADEEDRPAKGSAAALLRHAGALRGVFTDEVLEALAAQRRIPSRTFDWE